MTDRKINQIIRKYHSKNWSFWANKTEGSKGVADEIWKKIKSGIITIIKKRLIVRS